MRRYILFFESLLIFGMSIFGGFVQDDRITVVNNYHDVSIASVLGVWTRPYFQGDTKAGAYRPLTSLSFDINRMLLGNSAWGYHMINVILYVSLVLSVFELLLVLGLNDDLAFWISLVFLVHPIHVEAVANISGRAEVLSMFMAVMAMIGAKRGRTRLMIMGLLGAMMSKESGLVWVIPVMWLWWSSGVKKEERVAGILYVVLEVAIYWLLRWSALGANILSNNATLVENPLKYMAAGERIMNAVALLGFGTLKLLFPYNLSYDYSFHQMKYVESFWDWRIWMVVVTVMTGWFIWRWLKDKRSIYLIFFLLPLAMTSNIAMPIGTIFAERLWLAPSLTFIGLIVWFFDKLKWRYVWVLFSMVVLLFGVRSFVRVLDWQSEERLFIHDAGYVNESVIVKSNEAAMWVLSGNFENSYKALTAAQTIYPDYSHLMNNWGMYYLRQGKKQEARDWFERCIKDHPEYGLCKSNYEIVR